jgi:hypothetical protein
MSIEEPTLPAIIPPSDGPHTVELEAAYALFKEELASTEGWIDQGETNGVQIYSKPDPEVSLPLRNLYEVRIDPSRLVPAPCARQQDSYGIPTVKGEAILAGDVTSDAVSRPETLDESQELISVVAVSRRHPAAWPS